jgi:hypothetical protein
VVRRERQSQPSARACTIAGCLPRKSRALGAHFNTAGSVADSCRSPRLAVALFVPASVAERTLP